MEHLLWTEKYRPQTIEECILPERLKKPFQEYVNQKNIPNLLLAGGAGVGKTTVAKAMCNEIGCDYMVINGSDESGIDTFRTKIKNYASSMSLTGGRKVIIIDEADYLNPNSTQPALRNAIEEFASNCSFIFTCNYKNRIIEPLHSRCAVIEFSLKNGEKAKMASAFFKRVQSVLQSENVEFEDKVIAELTKKHFPDFRRIINELQRYSQFGKIDTGILAQIGDVSITEVVKFIRDKDFGAIRKWVATNEVDSGTLFRKIYESLYDVMKPQSIPQAVLILADYQYKAAFVADHEINTVACLTEIMVNCEFV
jgi:DNA polymerase III delta prime subunit|tara:strand:+ start:2175 stop:3107 length:933 start_codon:yes stop_codon:yes gene_type:complete